MPVLFAGARYRDVCCKCIAVTSSLAVIGLPSSAWAQDLPASLRTTISGTQGWQIHPALSVSESYSDNITLAPAGLARSEWTTRVRPSVLIMGNSARLRFSALYAPELLHRAVESSSGVSHFLDASGQAELLTRTLFVDFRSGISQQNVSLLGPQADSNINTTSNRTSIRTYSVSPYLRHEFGSDATGELRLTHDSMRIGGGGSISGNTGAVSNSSSNRVDATLGSGPAYKLMTWNIALTKSHIDYQQTGQKVDAERFSVGLGRLVTQDIRLNANAGYEDSGYPDSLGQKLKGTFWSVGPEWTPSPRTRVSATFGHRYFGASRMFHLEHRSRLTVWGLDYNEGVTTMRYNQTVQVPTALAQLTDAVLRNDPQFQDPVVRQAEVQNRIATTPGARLSEPLNFLTDALFLEKRLQGTAGIQGQKNTFLAGLFLSDRKALSSGVGTGVDFSQTQSIKQTGASLSWNSRLTGTLVSNVSLASTRNSFGSLNRTDRLTIVRWGITEQFTPKVTGSFNLSRLKNDSNQSASDYLENAFSVTLGMRY